LPHRPSARAPRTRCSFVFPAFLIFALGGCWLAVALERLDRGMRSGQDGSSASMPRSRFAAVTAKIKRYVWREL